MFRLVSVCLFIYLFSITSSFAQPVCAAGYPLTGNTVSVLSIGLFGYDGVSLALLATGKKEVTIVRSFYPQVSNPCLETINGKAYFNAYDAGGECYLWESDGTLENTRKLFPVGSQLRMKAVFNRLYYDAYANFDTHLWVSDGTSPGYRIASINTLFNKSSANDGDFFYASTGAMYNNDYYFTCFNGGSGAILRIPSTKTDTVKIIYTGQSSIRSYIVFKNKLYFLNANSNNWAVWSTDGTIAGTRPLWATYYGNASSPFVHKDKLYFTATMQNEGAQLFASDGTVEGTVSVVKNKGFLNIYRAVSAGNYFYFSNATKQLDWELWRSDGTQDGTKLVKDIRPNGSGYQDDFNSTIIAQDTIVYFSGSDRDGAQDVWRSNGSEAGTFKIIDFGYPNYNNYPGNFFVFESNLYFSSNNSTKVFTPSIGKQYSVQNGYWNIGSTWAGCRVPLPDEPVEVNHTVTLPTNYKAYNLKTSFNPNGKLFFGSGAQLKIGN